MAYQTLYRKYRPTRFADVIGQEHVVRTLQNAIQSDKVAHAYLFSGPRGTGKTTTARILAKTLNCTQRPADVDDATLIEPCNECASCVDIDRDVSFDVEEVDAASNRGIDDIRDISERALQAASDPSRHRVFIIDEVHQLSRDGASAFLKTLEEPPENVIFVLATTDPDKMIQTILSRCQRFDLRPVPAAAVAARLTSVCESEGIDAEPAALDAIARRARGGVRDALSALEQARSLYDDRISAAAVSEIFGGIDSADLTVAVQAIVDEDAAAALRHVDSLVNRGIDIRVFTRELVAYVRAVFVTAAAPSAPELVDATDADLSALREQAKQMGAGLATRALTALGQVLVQLPQSLNPRNDLDAALVALTHPQADASISGLTARIDALERKLASGGATPAASVPVAPLVSGDVADTGADVSGDVADTGADVSGDVADTGADVSGDVADTGAEAVRGGPDSGAGIDIDRQWTAVVAAVGDRSKRALTYLRDAVLDGLDGTTVRLRVGSDLFVQNVRSNEMQRIFGDITESVLGTRLGVDATVDGDASPVAPGASGSGHGGGDQSESQASTSSAPQSEAVRDENPHSDAELAALVDLDSSAPAESGESSTEALEHSVLGLITNGLDAEVVEERDKL